MTPLVDRVRFTTSLPRLPQPLTLTRSICTRKNFYRDPKLRILYLVSQRTFIVGIEEKVKSFIYKCKSTSLETQKVYVTSWGFSLRGRRRLPERDDKVISTGLSVLTAGHKADEGGPEDTDTPRLRFQGRGWDRSCERDMREGRRKRREDPEDTTVDGNWSRCRKFDPYQSVRKKSDRMGSGRDL